MKFVIKGNPPTKKNSQRLVVVKGRLIPIPSKNYVEYEKDAIWDITATGIKNFPEFDFPIDTPVHVTCVYYRGERRKVDLCNLLSATCDILVKAGVLTDDNCRVVASHDGSRVYYDKANPRVEIEITPFLEDVAW